MSDRAPHETPKPNLATLVGVLAALLMAGGVYFIVLYAIWAWPIVPLALGVALVVPALKRRRSAQELA